MSKSKPFTLEDLEKKGFVLNEQGDYEKAINVVKESIRTKPKPIGQIADKQPVINTPDFDVKLPLESFLTIPGLVAGLNGKNGLMNGHWTKIKKQKDLYRQIIRDQLKEGKIRKHEGSVFVTYIGYKSSFMDWDNFVASFKFIGDSLVKEKIIVDDNPRVIIEFRPKQIKCKRIDQKVVIIIEDI